MAWETVILKREELYKVVWSEPVLQAAQRYSISNVALAKICRKLNVPRPGRGYWARKAAGHEVRLLPLPPLKDGIPSEHRVRRRRTPVIEADALDTLKELMAREKVPGAGIVVPEQLIAPHRLIRLSLPLLEKRQRAISELLEERACLNIRVSPPALDRALYLMDALLKALESRGFEPVVMEPARRQPHRDYGCETSIPSKTGVRIGERFVEFALRENDDIIKLPPPAAPKKKSVLDSLFNRQPRPEYEHRPSGRLTLGILNLHDSGARLSWSDGRVQRLEKCLNDFIAALVMAAERMRLQQLEHEQHERARQEELRVRVEAEQRRQLEERLVYDLGSRLTDWTEARDIRMFVAAVEEDARRRTSEINPASELGQWIAWSRRRADTLEAAAIRTILHLRARGPLAPRDLPRDR
jgi:hypothetical protein